MEAEDGRESVYHRTENCWGLGEGKRRDRNKPESNIETMQGSFSEGLTLGINHRKQETSQCFWQWICYKHPFCAVNLGCTVRVHGLGYFSACRWIYSFSSGWDNNTKTRDGQPVITRLTSELNFPYNYGLYLPKCSITHILTNTINCHLHTYTDHEASLSSCYRLQPLEIITVLWSYSIIGDQNIHFKRNPALDKKTQNIYKWKLKDLCLTIRCEQNLIIMIFLRW